MDDRTPPIDEAIEAYFAGHLTAEHLAVLEAWINADPQHARAFMDELRFREIVGEHLREQANDTGTVLAELARIEMSSEAEVIQLGGEHAGQAKRPKRKPEDPGTVSAHDLVAVCGYLLGKALTSKPAYLAYAAAVALLCLIVLRPWDGEQQATDASRSVVQNDPQPSEPRLDPPIATTVATLTDAHQAHWSTPDGTPAPTPGDTLYAGQHLVLTAGFAELTTVRGAVVILQSPCRVELVDSPNSIRLHAGKLVGICKTQWSKGFIVRTAHMDVTDIGTHFGVACDENGTEVRVFQGEVQAATASTSDAKTERLIAGQSARITSQDQRVERIPSPATRFVTTMRSVVKRPDVDGIRYEPSIPSDLRPGAYENTAILMFPEQTGVVLQHPVAVNITRPGMHTNQALQRALPMDAATVDSYLIHLDPPSSEQGGRLKKATLRFDRPILGVITSADAMAQTHTQLGLADVQYATMTTDGLAKFSGLDKSAGNPETVHLRTDRRTLTLKISTGGGIDQFRVLVASE